MRIIYTYWTKSINPELVNKPKSIDTFIYYQTVSLYYLRKNIPSNYTIDIITDNFGKKLFEEKIPKLWDNIYCEMDDFNHYSVDRWALVKILKLFSLEPPFIHMDYDIIIKSPKLFNSLESSKNINYLYQTGEPITFHSLYMESFKKMKNLLKRYSISPTIAYNAGFNYFNKDISKIYNQILKYSKLEGCAFIDDMFFEQIVIPGLISKSDKVYTLNNLINVVPSVENYMKNFIKDLDYRHFASSGLKEQNIEYIKEEYKKIINKDVRI